MEACKTTKPIKPFYISFKAKTMKQSGCYDEFWAACHGELVEPRRARRPGDALVKNKHHNETIFRIHIALQR